MTLNVAVQMDHIAGINVAGDSTFALMLEAERRGHALHHYTPDRLAMRDGRVEARVEPVSVRDLKGDHYRLGQQPPFVMADITATHLLARIHPATLVVNDPAEVRNAPE